MAKRKSVKKSSSTKNSSKKKVSSNIKKKATKKISKSISKKSVGKNLKQYTPQDAIKGSLEKINRLEEIHKARKEQEMISDKFAFWIFLIISLVTNFSLSFILIFLIVFLQDPMLYLIVFIIGGAFGLVYSYMIHGLRYSMFHHHAFAKIFILLTGGINVFYIVVTSKIVLDFIGLNNSVFNLIGISITYFFAYLIPYFVEFYIRKFLK